MVLVFSNSQVSNRDTTSNTQPFLHTSMSSINRSLILLLLFMLLYYLFSCFCLFFSCHCYSSYFSSFYYTSPHLCLGVLLKHVIPWPREFTLSLLVHCPLLLLGVIFLYFSETLEIEAVDAIETTENVEDIETDGAETETLENTIFQYFLPH